MEQLIYLIEGCKSNDSKYQKVFYEKYLGFVLRIVYRYITSYESAAEVSNDAFIKIFKVFYRFECGCTENMEGRLRAWMKKIAINTAIDHLRSSQSEKNTQPLADVTLENKDMYTSSDEQLLYKELVGLIRKLSPSYRVVFNMYVIDGYTHQEIATALGISAGTSKSNLLRARAFLQKHLVKDNKDNILCFT